MNDADLFEAMMGGAPVQHCRDRLEHQRLRMISDRLRRDRRDIERRLGSRARLAA